MKKIALFILGASLFAASCTDPEKDPLLFDQITKGSIIALRGTAVDNLNTISFKGAVDTFNISAPASAHTFDFEADFLSDDLGSLADVQVYAKAADDAARVLVTTVSGSVFTIPSGGTYPRGAISIPMADIFSKIGKTPADYAPNSYVFIECDLTLKDGTVVPASAVVNSSLFESDRFYPAHSMRILAKP